MSYDAYISLILNKPFEIDLGDDVIKLRNMNDFSWEELYDIIDDLYSQERFHDRMKTLLTTDNYSRLSFNNMVAIVEGWQKHSGVTFQEVALVRYTIDEYPNELEYDLRHFLGIKGIRGLLEDSKPLEAFKVVNSLYRHHGGYLQAKTQDYKHPFSISDWMLSDLVVLTIKSMKEKPNDPVEYPMRPKENENARMALPFAHEDIELTQDQIDELLEEDILSNG